MLLRLLISILIAMAVGVPPAQAAGTPGPSPAAAPESGLCERAIAAEEKRHRIPVQLLQAISLAETGRWDAGRQASFAWPWTVMAEGTGHYLPDKQSAVRKVRELKARGVRNIDVGCMQVNLHYHPDAFDSLEEAFEPAVNVAYAAEFLKRLYRERRAWSQAIAHYHSATPELNRPYADKVLRLWQDARRRAIAQRRAARQAAWQARSAGR